MTAREFFELVEKMRYWQKRWFDKSTRTDKALSESRRYEQAVDAEIRRVRDIVGEKPKEQDNKLF